MAVEEGTGNFFIIEGRGWAKVTASWKNEAVAHQFQERGAGYHSIRRCRPRCGSRDAETFKKGSRS